MSDFEVEGPDGVTIVFPSGTDLDTVKAVMKKRYSNQPSTAVDMAGGAVSGLARGAAETAMAPVTLKRAGEGLVQTGMDYVRDTVGGWFGAEPLSDEYKARRAANLAASDPIGNLLYGAQDDARAAMDATLYKPKTDAGKYTESVTSFVPGALLGGAPTLAGKAGQVAKFAVAPGIASEAAGQATEGTKWEPWARAAGAMGGALAANAVRMPASMEKYFAPAGSDALSNVPIAAQRYVERNLSPAKVQAMKAEIDKLGPEGMLADVSPEWMGIARGAASRPDNRDEIVNALLQRLDGKNQRLNSAIDEQIGAMTPDNIPSAINDGLDAQKAALGPDYQAVMRGADQSVDVLPLVQSLQGQAANLVGAPRQAADAVLRMLREGANADGVTRSAIAPGRLLSARQAIDDMMQVENLGGNEARILGQARAEIDDLLQRSAPGIKTPDGRFQELSRQQEALDAGGGVLDSGKTAIRPIELEAQMRQGGVSASDAVAGPSAAPFRLRQGARAEIDRIVGQNANDVAALNRLLKGDGDWNRDKLRTIFGRERADKILEVLDAETAMARTGFRVTAGSDTALANRFGSFLDEVAKGNQIPADIGVVGGPLRGAQKIFNAISGNRAEAKAERFAQELGRLSVAQGANRDAVIQALLQRAQNMKPGQLTTGAEAVVRSILAGGASQ
jgi:hypothetical protein